MAEETIYKDEYIHIFSKSNEVFIEAYKKGLSMDLLSSILKQFPQIGYTNVTNLRNAIVITPGKPQKFGELKERILVQVSEDELTATISFNLPQDALTRENRSALVKEAAIALNRAGVVYGIKKDLFSEELVPGKDYVIAEGIPAVNGNDAVIKMYELSDIMPEVREDGSVDFYELKLINRVKVGDWLGERIEATEGYPGQSVRGNKIKPVPGKNYPLDYDKNNVMEVFEGQKTTLYSRINGAVNYTNGRLSVSNHLEIQGDIGLGTGNINFDGYLTVKGTVCDGFSVEATRDIEINSDLGLGNIKSITSTGGSIFIKGGISPKSRVEVRAAKNVFIKFIDNVNIICGGAAHIGYYILNSCISAREVIMDSTNGRIIGGSVKAEIKVSAPVIGSEIEKKTIIEVTGFDRQKLLQQLDEMMIKINELRSEQQKLKSAVSGFDSRHATVMQKKEYNDASSRLNDIKEEILILEEERKNTASYLKTRGEGEITAARKIHPNCTLVLGNQSIDVSTPLTAPTFFIQNGEVRQL